MSNIYAIVWFKISDYWQIGTSKAGGGNYDKKSAAVYHAVKKAGVNCYDFDGHGVDVAKKALIEIAEKVISDKKLDISSVCAIEAYA